MGPSDDLSKLPGELVENICSHLDAVDVVNMRLTCRALKAKTDRSFAVAYFGTSQFMITRESLQMLIGFAKNLKYGPRIKKLELCLVTFPTSTKSHIEGEPFTTEERQQCEDIALQEDTIVESEVDQLIEAAKEGAERQQTFKKHLKRRRRRIHGRYQVEQFTMRKQGTDMEMLVEALRNLPSLESIALVDVLDSKRPPWGARAIRDELGRWPVTAFRKRREVYYDYYNVPEEERRFYLSFLSHALAVTFGAIVKSNIKLKQSFSVDGALFHFAVPKKPDSRRLPPARTPAKVFCEERISELTPAFAELKELSLHAYNYHWNDTAVRSNGTPFDWILLYTPVWASIKSLSLQGTGLDGETHLFKMLSSSADIFPSMHHLKLEYLSFHVPDITVFLAHHSTTLRSMRIVNCRPVGHDYRRIIQDTIGSSSLICLELISNKKQPRRGYAWELQGGGLGGIGHSRVGIRGGSPENYQEKALGMLHMLELGDKEKVLYYSEEF